MVTSMKEIGRTVSDMEKDMKPMKHISQVIKAIGSMTASVVKEKKDIKMETFT